MHQNLTTRVINKINIIFKTNYKRIKYSFLKMNKEKKELFIPTYDGGNQSMHPKMLYFPNGWNGYKFWYITTPYYQWNDFIENPCIYVSNDGINYKEPVEGINPLDAVTDSATINYNSDPHLVYNSDKDQLECWWRLFKTNKSDCAGEYIYRRVSKDGCNWQEKELLYSSVGTCKSCVSPVVIYDNSIYKIWVNHIDYNNPRCRGFFYYESADGTNWKLIRDIYIPNNLYVFSHFDVIHTEYGYEMVAQAIDFLTEELEALVYMMSNDNITYSKPQVIVTRGKKGSFDDWRIYRPSFTKVEDDYWLYYGATSTTNNGMDWGTALIVYKKPDDYIKRNS